jgi:hypothetical protein
MMRVPSLSPAVLITAVLALALIAYVFLGGGGGEVRAAPHCTSRQALDQVKAELFRRAGATRGAASPDFAAVTNYSVLHASSQLVRKHEGRSGRVACSGSLTLDLPPGTAVTGGRRSLAAKVSYELEPGASGDARLVKLGAADAIVVPLATVSTAQNQTGELLGPAPETQTAPMVPPAPMQGTPSARPTPTPLAPTPRQAPPAEKAAPPSKVTPRPPVKAPPTAKPPASAAAPSREASAHPSFNCRYAHTAGEIAVCRNEGLAALDREMSRQFYSALRGASPGQRAMLNRSRDRFLKYRDRCSSDACVADAYRGRMEEIDDIVHGGW